MAMIACIRCAKRQHIACHDTTDRNSGRPPRNWQRDPFVCGRCRAAAMPIRTNSNTTSRTAQPSVVKGYGNPYGQITLQIPRQGPNPTSLPSHVQPYSWGSMPQAPQGAQFMNTHSRSPHTQGSYPAAQQLPGVVSMHPQAQVSGRHNPTPLGTNGHLHPSPYPSNGQQQYHDTRTYPATPATQSPVQLYPPPVQPSYMSRDSQQQSNPYALDTRSSMTSMQGYGQVNNHHQGLYMTVSAFEPSPRVQRLIRVQDPRGMGKPQGPFLGHDSQPASAPEMYAHMAAPPINGPPAVDINPHGQWPSSAAHQQYGRYPNFDSLAYGAPAQGRFPS